MERLYVVEENGRAAAGATKMARALSPYNRFVAAHAKPGRSMQELAAMWRSSGAAHKNAPAASAKARAEQRWSHNPPAQLLGMRIPAFLQDVNPLDVKNLKNVGALVGSAIIVVGAPMLAGSWNSGLTGLGLTALAAGAAAGGAALLSPALAAPVGIMGLGIVGLRAVVYFVPRVLSWIVNPLLGWVGATPPVSGGATPGGSAAPGMQDGFANRMRQLQGFTRRQIAAPTSESVPVGGSASYVVDRNFA